MLGVELADRLTTTEATGDDGVALALTLLISEELGVELAERLTTTDATGDDGVALTLTLPHEDISQAINRSHFKGKIVPD